MSEDLVKRLRGKYSVGSEGVREDRDFGSFTPRITQEAADYIEQLEARIKELEDSLLDYRLELERMDWEQ